jgi:hypothetical protein
MAEPPSDNEHEAARVASSLDDVDERVCVQDRERFRERGCDCDATLAPALRLLDGPAPDGSTHGESARCEVEVRPAPA